MSTKPTAEASDTATKSRFSRQIDEAFEAASKLAGGSLAPAEFYQEFLNSTLKAIDAPAGAVWLRTPQGFLQIACQLNLDKVGLDAKRGGRQCHNEILRQVFQAAPPRPVMIEPQGRLSGFAQPDAGGAGVPAANLTDFWTLFAPIVTPDKTSLGLLEVFQEPSHDPRLFPTFLNYTLQMAGYASQYHQFANARQSSSLERVFTQVESFAKQIHTSLNPTEVAYHVANEGRRLIECDRLCVGVRHGTKVTVESVSGADVVEKSSTHVRRMRILMDEVLKLGEQLIYKGEKDEGLPPKLSEALDLYLAESQPKLLVIRPIRDEVREKEKKDEKPKKARAVLLLESFNPPEQVEPLIQRLEIVGKHAAPALYNAAEMRRIPFGFFWRPLGKIQEGIGGKARFYWALGTVAVAALVAAMVLVPYPLKMEAQGEFQPRYTKQVFAPHEGEIQRFLRNSGDRVAPGAPVVELYSPDLDRKYFEVLSKKTEAESQIAQLNIILGRTLPTKDEQDARLQLGKHEAAAAAANEQLAQLRSMYNIQSGRSRSGFYTGNADEFEAAVRTPGAAWTVLSSDNRNELLHRTVKPNEPLVRLGLTELKDKDGVDRAEWRVEMKIPQRNIGHIARALATDGLHKADKDGKKYLDVDVLLTSQPDTAYPGRIYAEDIAGEAVPNRDDHNQSEPVVQAYVRVNVEGGAAIPRSLNVAGQEVHTRIRCGDHALGYSLFHGVYEWFFEKVVFFF